MTALADAWAFIGTVPNHLFFVVIQRLYLASAAAKAMAAIHTPGAFVEEETSPGSQIKSDEDWLKFARDNGQTIYHPIGTCRMREDEGADGTLALDINN